MELSIDRLTKQYQNKIAVDRISLRLNTGKIILTGCEWCGKNNSYENGLWYFETYKRNDYF